MANILGTEIPVNLPSFSGEGLSGTVIGLIALIIFVIVGGIIGLYLMNRLKVYNKRIVVFENIAGKGYQLVYKDRARLVRLGDGGEELLYLRKKKLYRAAYGRKMGKNTYWFAIGQDGYWYNIVLGDVDAKMGMLDIEPIDRDMRYMHVAIRKNIADRYSDKSFMDKYGTQIMLAVFLIIIIIGMGYLISKIAKISDGAGASVTASAEVVKASERLISSLDNICTRGGSSIVPVGEGWKKLNGVWLEFDQGVERRQLYGFQSKPCLEVLKDFIVMNVC